MLDSYLETAVWASNDWNDCDECDNPRPMDDNYDWRDFTTEAVQEAQSDCHELRDLLIATDCDGYANLWEAAVCINDEEHIGHDFWLTRNHHGAGFWDGDYGDFGDAITKIVHDNFSECNVWADQGRLYFE